MNLTFIGSGNLAWHLAPALENGGFPVREVYSRNRKNAERLAARLYEAEVKEHLDFSRSPSKIFFLAVADDALPEIVREIVLPDGAVLVHCSGSQRQQILEFAATPRTGVFYPLQTFSKGRKADMSKVPVFIEASDSETLALLEKLARGITRNVKEVNSDKRKGIHLAAVFASNFTNHMLAVAQDLTKRQEVDFELLKPLIAETINKALEMGPGAAQTGPARRGDVEILEQHLEMLSLDENMTAIYKHLSQSILDRYGDERNEG